jgi:hypothetical protein
MMESKDKIDLALRASLIAHAALEMIAVGSKTHAKVIYADVRNGMTA